VRDDAAQHFTSLRRVVYAKYDVLSFVWTRARTQNRRLNVAHFESGNIRRRRDGFNLQFRFILSLALNSRQS
jgi:hypothetical protein